MDDARSHAVYGSVDCIQQLYGTGIDAAPPPWPSFPPRFSPPPPSPPSLCAPLAPGAAGACETPSWPERWPRSPCEPGWLHTIKDVQSFHLHLLFMQGSDAVR